MRVWMSVVCLLFVWAVCLEANERRFAYLYESSVLPPGAREIELWTTYRGDRSFFHRRLDQRLEFEFGVAEGLMSSVYLNASARVQDSNKDLPGGGTVEDASFSLSGECKYKFTDRTADPVGFGLYGEATLGADELELEGKLILDKDVSGLLLAVNIVGEQEWETGFENGVIEREQTFLASALAGASYEVAHRLFVGLEFQVAGSRKAGSWKSAALFGGPVVSYASGEWWATLTIMPQWSGLKGATKDGLVLDEHERFQSRLLFSFHL